MLRNYLLIALRNLYKNKVYALINILGLSIALSICIVAYFNHMCCITESGNMLEV